MLFNRLAIGLLGPFFLLIQNVVFAETDDEKWSSWVDLGAFYGSDSDSRTEAVWWTPFHQTNHSLNFVEFRAKNFAQSVEEYNLAFGHRQMANNSWNFGGFGGVDARNSRFDNMFYQLTFGVEALHPDWDIRANTYLSISDPKVSPNFAEVRVSGNQIQLVGGEEVPLHGVDFEIGYRLPIERYLKKDISEYVYPYGDLRVYVGGFMFDRDEANQSVIGPRIRVAWRFDNIIDKLPGSTLTLEGEYSHDGVRNNRWEGGLRISIPFSFPYNKPKRSYASLNLQERRMVERLERDTDIVTGQSKGETVIDAITEVQLNKIVTASSGSNLQDAINEGGNNSLVIANGTHNGGVTLAEKQTLVGGQHQLTVKGIKSGVSKTFTVSGGAVNMTHTPNSAAITVASNTHVAGMNITGDAGTGAANNGIFGNAQLSNVAITGNTFTNMGNNGIHLMLTGNSSGRFQIENNTESSSNDNGIQIETFNNADVEISVFNNSLNNIDIGNGIQFDFNDNSNIKLTATGNQITSPRSDGFEFDIEEQTVVKATITNNVVSNTTLGEGLEIDQDETTNVEMIIQNNKFTNTFSDPIDIDLDNDSTGKYRIVGNSFNSSQLASIIDIDSNHNAVLDVQMLNNISNVNFIFDEAGTSTFRLENTINTNTFPSSTIDANIEIVPAGTFYTVD
jgi:inverse autotransporter-like protein with beta domain